MNFLVTGGAGFIGSNIVEALLTGKAKGLSPSEASGTVPEQVFVRVLDNFSTGKRENLSFIKGLSPQDMKGLSPKGTVPDKANTLEPKGTVPEVKPVAHEVFNAANGQDNTVLQLVDYLNKIIGKDIKPKFLPVRQGDVFRTCADISKIGKILGFKPKVNFEEGLKKTVEWFKRA